MASDFSKDFLVLKLRSCPFVILSSDMHCYDCENNYFEKLFCKTQ